MHVLRLLLPLTLLSASAIAADTADPIAQAIDRIERSIKPIAIPERTLDLHAFCGHRPDRDGTHDFRDEIQRAIDELARLGGGTLRFRHSRPDDWNKLAEVYRIRGSIELRSNLRLLLDRGVILRFEYSPEHYTNKGLGVITRYEGTTTFGTSPLIRAFKAENVVIEAADGHGSMPEITGDGDRWLTAEANWPSDALRPWEHLRDVNNRGVPLKDRGSQQGGHMKVRPAMVEFFLCNNVRMEGVKLSNSPFWVVHPVFSTNLTFRNLWFDCQIVNNDGIDPDSCRNVLIEHIVFNNHDDNVAVKSGRDREGREGVDIAGTELEGVSSGYIKNGVLGGPTEDVVVRHCVFKGHYAFCVGSETSGGARRLYVVDNLAPQDVAMVVFLKSSRRRGGTMEDIHVRNLQAETVGGDVVAIIPNYDGDATSPHVPTIRNVTVSHVTARKAGGGIRVFGWPESPTRDVHLRDISITRRMPGKPAFEKAQVQRLVLERVTVDGQRLDGDYTVARGDLPPAQN